MIENLKLNTNTAGILQYIDFEEPLQEDSQDFILQQVVLGGPKIQRDVRFIVDIPTLEYLLQVAKQSKTKRCVINRAGIRMKVRQSRQTGHVYETLHLFGYQPVPEQAPDGLKIQADENMLRHLRR